MKRQICWVLVLVSTVSTLINANSHKKQLEDTSDEQEYQKSEPVERKDESLFRHSMSSSELSMIDSLSSKEVKMLNHMMALMLNGRRLGAAFGVATGADFTGDMSSSLGGSHEEGSGGFQEEGTLEAHLGPAFVPLQVPEGYFVPFIPRQAFGVTNGVSRPAHAHTSFYSHRTPGLVNVRNSPAYGYLFTGHRRFQPQLE